MKKMGIAFTAAIIIALQVFSLAAAAPLATDWEKCGWIYYVKNNDNLYKISGLCETTVSNIQNLNPEIEDTNMIFPQQKLRLSEAAPAKYLPTYSGFIASNGSIRISISVNQAKEHDEIKVFISGFPSNAQVEYQVGRYGEAFSIVYEGEVDEEGNGSMLVDIPSNAEIGEYWAVRVQTTSEAQITRILSPKIAITGHTYNDTPNTTATVTLSTTQVKPGGKVTVYVSGFPANSLIDYRVGKYGQDYVLVYDGVVDGDGKSSAVITIPTTAEKDQIWVVHVQTTSHVVGVDVTSPKITIIE